MNNDILGGIAAFGFLGTVIAATACYCSHESKEQQIAHDAHQRYVMEHPDEYSVCASVEAYNDIKEKLDAAQREVAKYKSTCSSLNKAIESQRKNYEAELSKKSTQYDQLRDRVNRIVNPAEPSKVNQGSIDSILETIDNLDSDFDKKVLLQQLINKL